MDNQEAKIFYSWQSDLKQEINHYFIRDAIKSALKRLNKAEENIILRVETATDGLTGSPNIEQAIFNKIDECAVFVGDITLINATQKDFRKTPNPNVLIELGYAIHGLGWSKIILVHNNHYGKIEDVPFDIRGHRISQYNFDGNVNNKKQSFINLENTFYIAIKACLSSKEELKLKGNNLNLERRKEVCKNRDIRLLERLFNKINTHIIDDFLANAKLDIVNGNIFYFWENFRAIVNSSSFHLYDQELQALIIDFYTFWDTTLSYGGQHCIPIIGRNEYKFTSPHYSSPASAYEQWDIDYSNFHSAIDCTESAFKKLIKFVQEKYLEIDIDDSNKKAMQSYNSEMNLQ
ncbi:MAG: hypothetical protein HEQ33_22160 [Dolichospermum sp. WA123]|nr:hypothetical protein [Dolichospermum sp. WA123]